MKIYPSTQDTLTDGSSSLDSNDQIGATLLDNYYYQPASFGAFDGGNESFASAFSASISDSQVIGLGNAPTAPGFPPDGSLFVSNAGGSHGGGGGGGGGGTPAPYTTPTLPGNNLTFVIDWDSSVGSAPSGFVTAFETAALNLQKSLNSPFPDTITLNVGWGETDGQKLPFGALGESATNIYQVNYAALQTAMSSYLPQTDPITGTHSYWVASAEEKALGLMSNNNSVDASVGFSSHVNWNFTPFASTGYDFISVAEHEISEAMGRISLTGATVSDNGVNFQNSYSPLDLFRYSAPGVRSLVGGQTAYFSPDGGNTSGATNLVGAGKTYFNSTAGGDWGDWQSSGANSAGNDAYSAFSSSGTEYSISGVDQTVMNVLGYHS